MAEVRVIVRSMGNKQIQFIDKEFEHSIVLDEPEIRGGDNLGPSPFSMALGGLGG